MNPARRAYDDLVAARRRRGRELYGDRHLHGPAGARSMCRVLTEVADCCNYLQMEITRWERDGGHDRALPQLRDLFGRAEHLGEHVADVARDLCDPASDFETVRTAQWAWGEATHGNAYLTRENLSEALEELADASVYTTLHADRLRFEDNYPERIRLMLVDVDDQLRALAYAIADTRAHATADTYAAAA